MNDDRTALACAIERLERSRGALRHVLLPPADDAGPAGGRGLPRRWRAWLRAGPLAPITRALDPWLVGVHRSLQRWWRRHPWRASAEIAAGSIERAFVPWAHRHPVAAVALGAAAGAAVVAAAPWRRPAWRRAAGDACHRATRWLLRQASSPAAQAALAGVATSLLAASTAAPRGPAPPTHGV